MSFYLIYFPILTYSVNIFFLFLDRVIMLSLDMSSAFVKTSIHYNLNANAIASMNDYFNTVLFRIHIISFITTVVKLF